MFLFAEPEDKCYVVSGRYQTETEEQDANCKLWTCVRAFCRKWPEHIQTVNSLAKNIDSKAIIVDAFPKDGEKGADGLRGILIKTDAMHGPTIAEIIKKSDNHLVVQEITPKIFNEWLAHPEPVTMKMTPGLSEINGLKPS
jgi:hypothetical protein